MYKLLIYYANNICCNTIIMQYAHNPIYCYILCICYMFYIIIQIMRFFIYIYNISILMQKTIPNSTIISYVFTCCLILKLIQNCYQLKLIYTKIHIKYMLKVCLKTAYKTNYILHCLLIKYKALIYSIYVCMQLLIKYNNTVN